MYHRYCELRIREAMQGTPVIIFSAACYLVGIIRTQASRHLILQPMLGFCNPWIGRLSINASSA